MAVAKSSRIKTQYFLIIILIISTLAVTLLEILNLTKVSLWHDEAFSALLVQYPLAEMMARIQMDVHPPLYYIILRGWTDLFTNSLFSLRLFSVVFSFLSIIAVCIFINKAFKNRILALLASSFYALSYFQIQYAMEARMYALGTFLVIISGYLLLTALEKRKFGWWILYAISIGLAIYTHYFAALWVMSQAIYLILFFRNALKSALFAYFLAFISYLPWLPTFFKQFSQVQEAYWIPAINIWSIPNTFSKMTFGAAIDPGKSWPILILLTAIITISTAFFLKKIGAKEKWLFFFSFFVPFFIAAALSYKRSIYIDRYFIFGFPFYMAILTGAVMAIAKKNLKLIIVSAAIIGISITFPYQWNKLNVAKKPGMSAAAKYLNENTRPNEKIFVGSSLIYFAFKYYNNSGIPAKLYAPQDLLHFSGTALLSSDEIITDFFKEVKRGDIVWMLNTTGFGNYQPAVPQNWTKIDEKGFEEANAYQGWTIVAKYKID